MHSGRGIELAKRSSLYRAGISIAIFLLFVAAAELLAGWTTILYPWRLIDNPWAIVAPAALVMLTYVIRAARLYRYFRMDTGFSLCLRLILQHSLLVHLLPMRAGEFAFPVLMKRYFSMGPARTLPALAWLRLLDLHALGLIIIFIAGTRMPTAATATAIVAWMACVHVVFLWAKKAAARLETVPGRMAATLRLALAATPDRAVELLDSWLLTFANWLLKLAIFGWIIQAFASSSYTVALAGAIAGELSSLLPVSGLAGFGSYEAGVVAAMGAFGTSVDDALTGAANLHLLTLGISIIGGSLSLLIPGAAARDTARIGEATLVPLPARRTSVGRRALPGQQCKARLSSGACSRSRMP